MRIKRIEIIGFKSFCDRTVLNFDKPVTGVVGPNGCGKSNIVDAIRWCMGEQSAKHLRGQGMSDVIFAGSDSRDPAGMAEVSLTFEDVGYSSENLAEARGDGVDASRVSERAPGNDSIDGSINEQDMAEFPAPKNSPEQTAGSPTTTTTTTTTTETDGGTDGVFTKTSADVESENFADEQSSDHAASQTQPLAHAVHTEATDAATQVLADRPPPIDYAQFSEVTITRRLFRDGTSQYLLNKTPCRLRDVTDFFLGTGVGTKAYSIIEQGRIGMIVSSRASERRHIIEEAAGITKFRAKKRAAERKLEQTRQNLLRVTDIVEELGKRLGTLRRQAQKAERFRRYRAEVKDIELHIASHKYLGFVADQKRFRLSQAELAEALTAARTEFEALESHVVAERAELLLEERRLAGIQENIYELDNRIKLTESKIGYLRKEADELEERVASAHGEIRSLAERRNNASSEVWRHRQGLGALESELGELHSEASMVDAAFAAARVELAQAESELERTRVSLAEARSQAFEVKARRDSLEHRCADSQQRLERVLEETTELNHRSAILGRDVVRMERALGELKQQRLDLSMRTEEMEARQSELSTQSAKGETAVETLRDELHRRRSRLQSLREINERYEGFARGTRAVMQRRGELLADSPDAKISGLVADVVSVPENLEVAVEAALGDRLGGILVSSPQVSSMAIDYLKQTSSGRSSFVPVPTSQPAFTVQDRTQLASSEDGVLGHVIDLVRVDPGYESLASDLLGGAVVVESLSTAFHLRERGKKGTLVTLEGDVLDERGVVTGGSREATGSGVLAQKREIRELDEICQSLESDLAMATARFVSLKTELTRVTKTLESMRSERHDGELAITAHERDLAGARAELDRVRLQTTRLNAEQLELEEQTRTAQREASELAAFEADAAERAARYERETGELTEALPEMRDRVEATSNAVTEAKVRVAQLGEQRASAEASALRLENARHELEERIGRLELSIATDTERAGALRSEAQELETETSERSIERNQLDEQLRESRQGYQERTTAIGEAEIKSRQVRQDAESLSSEVTSLEMKLTNLTVNREHLEEGIEERYRVVLDELIFDYHLRPVVTKEDKERLVQRKKIIGRMGTDINLTAIEEFAEINERHEFLSGQKVDLENAVDQLEKAITKINRVSRKLFKETFDAVNANFSEMFPRLFRGGRARLKLTGGEGVDLLDAGVEIMAQPPGKKNSTVDQLSGGEKALTAVALIFSIFLIKPSPFCLLDEVDAPLDDANVDRYNQALREMTKHSQFICITHNKRTMEIADRLYGVTMQEPGVSKIVTVNLSKIGDDGQVAA